jgi:hypothetical protein
MVMRHKPLPPLPRNPFWPLSPIKSTPMTIHIPVDCLHSVNQHGAALKTEVRQWLVENTTSYACRVIENIWVTPAENAAWRNHPLNRQNMAFITFENENDLLHFKMRWS